MTKFLSWELYFFWRKHLDWIQNRETMIRIFTEKDTRLNNLLREVCGLAEQKGFLAIETDIRWVRSFVGATDVCAEVYSLNEIYCIYIFSSVVYDYSDDELRLLIAHEVGHIIDWKSRRAGHPVFPLTRSFNREEFADFIVAYLYSSKSLFRVAEKRNWDKESLRAVKNLELRV